MNPILETALRLAARGLRVTFLHRPAGNGCTCSRPDCTSRGKHPIVKAWQKLASSDEQQIKDTFAEIRHACNLGVALGPCSAGYIIAIDVDSDKRRAELVAQHGELTPTLTGRSPRGARLFYCVADEDAGDLKNVTGIGGVPGVDCKVRGGQVVVAPSLHETGREYTWDNIDTPIADIPITWLQAILPPPKPARPQYSPSPTTREVNRHRRWAQSIARREAERVARAPEGQRNAVLYSAACRTLPAVYEAGLSGFDARNELTNAAKAAGLPEREIATTIKSADDWVQKNNVRRVAPDLRVVGNAAVKSEPQPSDVQLIEVDGTPAKLEENVARMVATYPLAQIRYDEFAQRVVYGDTYINDEQVSIIRGWLHDQREKSQRVMASYDTVVRGIQLAAMRKPFHPVRAYLDSLEWDRKPRVERFFVEYFGVDENKFSRAVSRLFLLGLIARIRVPGCKLDETPILEGEQGLRKSSALAALVGDAWFRDTKITIGDKDSKMAMFGVWLYELPELASMKARDVETTKAFMTERFDDLRLPYGRFFTRHPRQCAFVGTTNDAQYLYDRTGNRRWLPLHCTRIDRDAIARDRDQIFAEASALYVADPPNWWTRDEETIQLQRAAAADREAHEPLDDLVAVLDPEVNNMTSYRILAHMGFATHLQNPATSARLGQALRRAGWTYYRPIRNFPRVWRRP